ncbi:hypothetical protein CLF_112085 [Clonorchis sinensis]|uniref:Uncharacterized protein n=1 Tax=Clonorchis sinensis TaxID=79923 RepID=G7YVT9_CLOSI|nr:hypothetical protein CLF_112085 [Clonorchis sinensis]
MHTVISTTQAQKLQRNRSTFHTLSDISKPELKFEMMKRIPHLSNLLRSLKVIEHTRRSHEKNEVTSAIDSSLDPISRFAVLSMTLLLSASYDAVAYESCFYQLRLKAMRLCPSILSDKRYVVRLPYGALYKHTNEYTQKLVVEGGNLLLKLNPTVGTLRGSD